MKSLLESLITESKEVMKNQKGTDVLRFLLGDGSDDPMDESELIDGIDDGWVYSKPISKGKDVIEWLKKTSGLTVTSKDDGDVGEYDIVIRGKGNTIKLGPTYMSYNDFMSA